MHQSLPLAVVATRAQPRACRNSVAWLVEIRTLPVSVALAEEVCAIPHLSPMRPYALTLAKMLLRRDVAQGRLSVEELPSRDGITAQPQHSSAPLLKWAARREILNVRIF